MTVRVLSHSEDAVTYSYPEDYMLSWTKIRIWWLRVHKSDGAFVATFPESHVISPKRK